MSLKADWYFPRKQPGLRGRSLFHAIVTGQVMYLPDIAPLAESGVHGEHEREQLRLEQHQFLHTMVSLEELTGDIPPAFDLRIGVQPRTGSNAQLLVAVVGRATSTSSEEAEEFAEHLWSRLSTAFPANYGFTCPSPQDHAFISAVLPSAQELEHTRIWEIEKKPYPVRYGDSVTETVGTYGEVLDSMIAGWNALAQSREPLLLSIRCTPVGMSAELRGQLDYLYQLMSGGSTFDPSMNVQDAPLIEDARRRLENLLSSMQLMHMRIQVVSWGNMPTAVLAAIQTSLSATSNPEHRRCECQVSECLRSEQERSRDEIAHVMLDDTLADDNASLLQNCHKLLTVEEVSAAWRLPLARRYGISGIQFERDPLFTPEPLPLLGMRHGHSTIKLGTVLSRRSDRHLQELDVNALSKHALILGEPGSGKSTTTQSLVYQLWLADVPSMVIDPVSTEYRELWELSSIFRDGPKSLCVFTPGASPTSIGDIGTTLSFNPFCPQAGVSLDAHIMSLKDCIGSALALLDAWRELVGRALRNAYQNIGWPAKDPIRNRIAITAKDIRERHFPTFIDFIKAVEEEIARFKAGEFRSNTEAGLLGRLRDLAAGPLGSIIHTRHPLDVTKLTERPVVIELRAIGQANGKSLIMLFLLTQLRQYYDSLGRSGGLKHVVIVEEAHRLLSPSPLPMEAESNAQSEAINVVVNMLAELRKVGVGLVLVEQLPSRLETTVVKLPSIKILHRLPAKDDREMLASAMNMSIEQTKYVTTFLTGQAAFYTEGLKEPLLLQIVNPWGPELKPTGQRSKPQDFQQQEALERQVEEHTLHTWPGPTGDNTPWDLCTICQCECRPRLKLLEAGWWRNIQLDDIVVEAQKAFTSSDEARIDQLIAHTSARITQVMTDAKVPEKLDDQLCALTLALEKCVQKVAIVNKGRTEVQNAEKTIDNFLLSIYSKAPKNS